MRLDLNRIENEIAPLLVVHGVELVALEWFRGPGHGILRVTVDAPGGSPQDQDPSHSVSLAAITDVTRDVSTAMDALDLIDGAYTLEVGSPGPERPVQKRADFDRFAGMRVRLDVRRGPWGKAAFSGVLRGTVDHSCAAGFAVRVDVQEKLHEIPASDLGRAYLHEMAPTPKPKPGKGPSRRQQRLAAREQARTVNAAHLVVKWTASSETVDTRPTGTHEDPKAQAHDPDDPHSQTKAQRWDPLESTCRHASLSIL